MSENSFDYSPRLTCSEGTIISSVAGDGLLTYYKLDNNYYDISLNDKHGMNYGAVASANRLGIVNTAMYFNGTTYIYTGSDISCNNTNQITVSFWVKPDNINDTNKGILGKNAYEWTFYQKTDALAVVYWDNAGGHAGGMEIISTPVLAANQWVYFTYTRDGVTGKIYINGDVNNSRTLLNPSMNRNHTLPYMIGGNVYAWGNIFFKGSVNDIQIYSRALTASEILNNYKIEKTSNM